MESIIPKSYKTTATFPTATGLKSAKAAKVFAQDAGNLVKVSFDGKSIEMSAQDRETGSNETKIKPDHIEGEEQSIGFNVKMLIDFMSIKNGGEMVIFEIENATKPGVFKYQGDPDFIHVLMPMHLRD
jgi:DNA polymerase III sliding clamp (beta) subunit (PCNA family)